MISPDGTGTISVTHTSPEGTSTVVLADLTGVEITDDQNSVSAENGSLTADVDGTGVS
ncbi:MAG TPA: hypothetical protein H9805_00685 [Candidatus Janibacter merdipullorum]|nr:hypothetical protein [Candidatus Janibacter merdipullorum]